MANGPDMGVLSTIYRVGRELGATDMQMAAAFSAALVESGARNVDHGDRDSLGVFQQRPSKAWGTNAQVMDPEYAARAFFTGAGTNPGALDYSDWSGTPGQLAQQVQRSAYPHRYDQRLDEARALMSQVASAQGEADPHALALPPTYDQAAQFDAGDALRQFFQGLSSGLRRQAGSGAVPLLDENLRAWVEPRPDDPVNPALREQLSDERSPLWFQQRVSMPGDLGLPSSGPKRLGGEAPRTSEQAQDFIQRASRFVGTPYVWGGADPSGFDCSGLIFYVAKQMGIDLPRVSRDQARVGTEVSSLDQARPGDLVAFPARGLDVGHIGIYLGGGKMLHAPRRGRPVEVADIGNRTIATIRRIFTQDRVTRL